MSMPQDNDDTEKELAVQCFLTGLHAETDGDDADHFRPSFFN